VISARPHAKDFSYDQCIRVIAMPKPNTLAFGVGAKPGGRGEIHYSEQALDRRCIYEQSPRV
jgi:hypothetical protein